MKNATLKRLRRSLSAALMPAVAGAALAAAGAPISSAHAAPPALRHQVDLAGNFVIFGNTLALECDGFVPPPVVGEVGNCTSRNSAAPDVFWRADPNNSTARADFSFSSDDARSAAVLELPDGATVAYARLYWGGLVFEDNPDRTARIQRTDTSLDEVITADDEPLSVVSVQQPGRSAFFYQSSADVSELIQEQGPGQFILSGINAELDLGFDSAQGGMATWYMVVFYELPSEPLRNLAIFDGLEFVGPAQAAAVSLSGFRVPSTGFDATLGVVAFEGETQFFGDQLAFNGSYLGNGRNPMDNFFNATHTVLGEPVSTDGDLPQLSGEPGGLTNVDMDVIDVTGLVRGGDTSAAIAATSLEDIFLLSGFVTSISTLVPNFTESSKSVTDVDGGSVERGDTLEYRIVVKNHGTDAAEQVVLRDPLPKGITFVPGSLKIERGPGMGDVSDQAGDDVGEYDEAERTLIVRLGQGATATAGGSLEIGDDTEVVFQATVDPDAAGVIENQGEITFVGRAGAPESTISTDADADVPGQNPTTIEVDGCQSDRDCMEPLHCEITKKPQICVECTTSGQCTDPAKPDCNPDSNVCECAAADGMCVDTDMDGISDGAEEELGTDPNDADTDDDGALDGDEVGAYMDTDGDRLKNALDPDSDNDALPDGIELGYDCEHPGTDKSARNCRADLDEGQTETRSVDADTDDGSIWDGSEDQDLDGTVDTIESNPTLNHPEDDEDKFIDTDGDGLSDGTEATLHSDPNDGDTDDDGVIDGQEVNPGSDDDGDGLPGVLDPDSDNDGLPDGTELGLDCDLADTDKSRNRCTPDADMGETVTSPVVADTDGGGQSDGSEDINLNGAVDDGETQPVFGQGIDDETVIDTDGDGLSDGTEGTLGTDPNDRDSDDDGVIDGKEPNPADDQDGDGKSNPLDSDSDDDDLADGTELGLDCSDEGTDPAANACVADGDGGTTRTSPLLTDTDYGTKPDGEEDANKNGVVDMDETDPENPGDDIPCMVDSECGDMNSGRICVDNECVDGCRGEDGNSCPENAMCTSSDSSAGECEVIPPEPEPEPEPIPVEPILPDKGEFAGGGCDCRVGEAGHTKSAGNALLLGLALTWLARRRKQR